MNYRDLKKNDTLCIIGSAVIPGENPIPFSDDSKDKMWVGYSGWAEYKNLEERGVLEVWYDEEHLNYMYFIDVHTRHTRKPEYISFLQDHQIPILMQTEHTDLTSVSFPRCAIIDTYGIDYFMCTMSYMVAWAMFMKYKRIEVYRVAMTYDDDLIQRYNFEYWLGRATQAEIEVIVSEESGLLKAAAYGYEVDNTLGVYMQKHLSFLRRSTIAGIDNALVSLSNARSAFLEANAESVKFNREILNRHKIDTGVGEEE